LAPEIEDRLKSTGSFLVATVEWSIDCGALFRAFVAVLSPAALSTLSADPGHVAPGASQRILEPVEARQELTYHAQKNPPVHAQKVARQRQAKRCWKALSHLREGPQLRRHRALVDAGW
jgi:hypothetical protein